MRMSMRRFMRLTNPIRTKKRETTGYALAVYGLWYDWGR